MNGIKNKRVSNVLLILFILTFVVILLGSSFAFFTARVIGRPSSIKIQAAELGTSTAQGTAISLYVSEHDMNEIDGSNSYTAYKESSEYAILSITTSTGTKRVVECTYDLTYKPTNAYNKSGTNTSNLKEFTLLGTPVAVNASNTTITGEMPEINLTGVTSEIVIVSGAKLIVTGEKTEGQVEWRFTPRYYNLRIDQTENADSVFGGTIQIGSIACLSSD